MKIEKDTHYDIEQLENFITQEYEETSIKLGRKFKPQSGGDTPCYYCWFPEKVNNSQGNGVDPCDYCIHNEDSKIYKV